MIIREASQSDAELISELIRGVAGYFTTDPDGQGAEKFMQTITPDSIRTCITDPGFHYLVACEDDRLAGVAAIKDNRHLYHLFVAPDFQGQGLARQLWQSLRTAAIASGNNREFTVNSTPYAVPVYEHFGFQATGPIVEKDGIAFVPMKLE